jgi:DNA polymerase/3'-5' exonuclease PolX
LSQKKNKQKSGFKKQNHLPEKTEALPFLPAAYQFPKSKQKKPEYFLSLSGKILLFVMGRVRRKKNVYKTVSFKLSAKQMKSLKNYCKARKTTPVKLIKKSIRQYTESFSEEVPRKYYVTANQLDIFEDNNQGKSLELFE